MESYQPLLVLLVALVMGWFGGGILWNLRRGNALLKWLQAGLPAVGERTTLRWLGSSAVELVIAKARPPFRRFELVLVMEPRDVPWLWLLSRARGRRDLVILRGQLNSAPRLEFDLVAAGSWTGRSALAQAVESNWGDEPLGEYRFLAPRPSLPVSSQQAPDLLACAQKVHPGVWRVAVRREFPQLELHIPMPDPKSRDARQFFENIRALGQKASKGQ